MLINRLTGRLKKTLFWLRGNRGAVAMIFGLSAPMLIAMTGLSVDVGYWYQNQTALQSAVDAGALAAAENDARLSATYSGSNAADRATAALPLAKAVADSASASGFGFAAGAPGTGFILSAVYSTNTSGGTTTSTTTYTANASIPRRMYFGAVNGLGLQGLSAGTQSALAVATATTSTSTTTTGHAGGCLVLTGTTGTDISATGGAKITTGSGCGIVVNSTTACQGGGTTTNNGSITAGSSSFTGGAIDLNPSATLTTSSINTANGSSGVCVDTNGQASIAPSSGVSSVTYASGGETDPFVTLQTQGLPPWPSMPTPPTPSATVNAASFAYSPFSNAWGSCVGSTAVCTANPYGFTGGISTNTNQMTFTGGSNASTLGSTYIISGGMALSNGTDTFQSAPSTYYMTGVSTTKKGVTTTGYGISFSVPTVTMAGGVFYINGGMEFNGSTPNATIGKSTFLLSTTSDNYAEPSSGNGAAYLQEGTLNFSGGTFFFDGGLNISGSANVTFGPGIYYFRNGDFVDTGSGKLTANNATFIFEGTASYQLSGGGSLTLSAPVADSPTAPTTCVVPFSTTGTLSTPYPQPNYSLTPVALTPSSATLTSAATTNYGTTGLPPNFADDGSGNSYYFPWDGTNGLGLCGVLFYQTADDTATDAITEGGSDTLTGIVYSPNAALVLSGGTGSIAAAGSGGTLAVVANSVNLTGSASLTLSTGSTPGTTYGGAAGGIGNTTTTTTTTTIKTTLIQ